MPAPPAVISTASFPDVPHGKKRAFLVAYCQVGTVTHAAAAAQIDVKTHRNWLKSDPIYAVAFDQAKDHAADFFEREARRRAIEGVIRFRFSPGGKPYRHPVTGEPYYEVDYSDTLLIFMLKALRPDQYREHVVHTGQRGGPIRVQAVPLDRLTEDELAQLEAADALVRRLGDDDGAGRS